MIKLFVIDTNTLISAHLIRESNPRKVFNKVLDTGVLVQSKETLNEFSDKFVHNKFDRYLSLQSRIKAINELDERCLFVNIYEEIKECRDQKDDKFLSLAWNAKADYLITGDKDLLVLNPFREIPVLNPTQFLESTRLY